MEFRIYFVLCEQINSKTFSRSLSPFYSKLIVHRLNLLYQYSMYLWNRKHCKNQIFLDECNLNLMNARMTFFGNEVALKFFSMPLRHVLDWTFTMHILIINHCYQKTLKCTIRRRSTTVNLLQLHQRNK